MKFTIRKLLLALSMVSVAFGSSSSITAFAPTRLNRILYRIAPYLPQRLQQELGTIELYWLIEEFLDHDNAKPLKYFFEQAALFITKNREFVKTTMKPELDNATKEKVIDSILKKLHDLKTSTYFTYVALSFYPLSKHYFPAEQHPYIKQHLAELKAQLHRRIDLNKKL